MRDGCSPISARQVQGTEPLESTGARQLHPDRLPPPRPESRDFPETLMNEATAAQKRAEEAQAIDRVVLATQKVQTAFKSLQSQFPPEGSGQPSKLALQVLDAALQELEDAQMAFDSLLNDLLDGER